jgi:hypothetical protein
VPISAGERFFSFPHDPDWLWGPHSLIPNGYLGIKRLAMKLTTYIYLVPRSRMVELYLLSPICLHGMVLN